MLVILVTLFIIYLIYTKNKHKITCSKWNIALYIIISVFTSLCLLKAFMKYFGYTNETAFLWSIYLPFSLNLSYLYFNTICFRKINIVNIILWIKSIVCTILLITCINAYQKNYICVFNPDVPFGHFMFSIAIFTLIVSSFFLLYGEILFHRLETFAYQVYEIILILTPLFMFLVLEISSNPNIWEIGLFNTILNILIMMFLEIIILNLFKNRAYGFYLLYIFVLVIGITNYYVVKFRNTPIMIMDILAIKTALSVSSQYQYHLTDGITTALIVTFLLISLISSFNRLSITNKINTKKEVIIRRFLSALVLVICFFWIRTTDIEKSYAIKVDFWNPSVTYNNSGFATAFIAFLQKQIVTKPEDYSNQLASDLLKKSSKERIVADIPQPNIIVIMNETFSDLSVLGPLECTEEHLKNLYSVKNDANTIEYGYNYVSTRGGGTSTTEFEFLTGNSMSNLVGSNPYTQFNFTQIPSIIHNIKFQGYRTIAMHPEDPNNWRRKSVYKEMGFDEFLSYKDFQGYETTVYDRISDIGNYKKLIDMYETQIQPSFIFNVTIQNHGGYDINVINESERVSIDDKYMQYSDVQAYESLINDSDEALGYLLNYFKKVKEPVIICFFGDHQPSLNNEFERYLINSGEEYNDLDISVQEKYFAVPYFIWSNYNVKDIIAKNNSEGINITSTNYLGCQVQYYAGLNLSDYGNFLLDQKQKIPAINYIGYFGDDNQWYSLADESSFLKQIKKYQIVQYNAMFDKKKKIESFR